MTYREISQKIRKNKMMKFSKKRLLYALCFLLFSISFYQVYALNNTSQYNIVFSNKNYKNVQNVARIMEQIINDAKNKSVERRYSYTDLIRAVLEYTYNNSVHIVDDEHEIYASNREIILEKMYMASTGNIEERPHLSCGPRSYIMKFILNQFHIYSRLVQIYTDEREEPAGHRLLEVYNPDTKSWEAWDPDNGVVYVDRDTKRPLDILTIIFSDKNTVVPIGVSAEGWEKTETEHLKKGYFKSVLFEQDSGMKNTEIIVNSALFDMNKVFASGLTFEEWAKKYYAHPRIISLPLSVQKRIP